jgi:hypothetical protein
MRDRSFRSAMAAYAVLAVAAWGSLDAELLWGVWILLGVLAVKTILVVLRRRLD